MSQYGRVPYGQSEYGREFPRVGFPTVQERDPDNDAVNVQANTLVKFNITDWNEDIDPSSVVIIIVDTVAYSRGTSQNGFAVLRTTVDYGYRYAITPPEPFLYQKVVPIYVTVSDLVGHTINATWSFTIQKSPACFGGQLNSFERSLLGPYDNANTTLYFTEQLRTLLIESAVNTPDPEEAIRNLYLRAHSTELSTILRDIVPTPTNDEKSVALCYKRTLLQMDQDLQRKPGLLDSALQELPALGLPLMHLQLLLSYLNTGEPDTRLPLACVVVFLAKALENNELV